MNNRIKELRKTLDLTQTEFGDKIGLTTSAISDMERGKVKIITDSNIKLICKTFNVSEEWLRNGDGQPFNNEYEYRNDLSDLEKEILTKFNLLDDDDKKAISTIIDSLYVKATKE